MPAEEDDMSATDTTPRPGLAKPAREAKPPRLAGDKGRPEPGTEPAPAPAPDEIPATGTAPRRRGIVARSLP